MKYLFSFIFLLFSISFLSAQEKNIPGWAVPWANLCILYNETKNAEKSLNAGQTAESLQPGLQLANTGLGMTYENSGNLTSIFYRQSFGETVNFCFLGIAWDR